jgi:hypothetical protein
MQGFLLLSATFALILSSAFTAAQLAQTLSICSADSFNALRVCGAYCISWGSPDRYCDYLAVRLGCSNLGDGLQKVRNDCFCRSDLVASAHSILSSCVNDQCSKNTVDLQQVMSVYDGYCADAGESG